ncbi:MAG: DeoR/GlpR transcriptional regulator [Clostridia bacterium]|nr:DeoR/GlpR transcriptional regulator [Clostridia bacterium]
MLTHERYKNILDYLAERDAATVSELAQATGTSESTIRRDLVALDKEGRLRKVYGGAAAINRTEGINEDEVKIREVMMPEEKEQIAAYAAQLINNDDFIYIDSGTTTSRLIEHIGNTNATFVTNGIIHAQKLLSKGLKAYMLGGRIRSVTASVVGSESIRNMLKYNFTKAFLGTNGIDITAGFTTPDNEEAMLKEKAIEKSFAVFVLADHSKFRKVYPVTFAELRKCCVITDKLPYSGFLDKTVIREVTK